MQKQKQKQIMAIAQKRLRYSIFIEFHRFVELRFAFCRLQRRHILLWNIELFCDFDYFLENSVRMILDYPAVVYKGTDTQTLVLTPASSQKCIAIATD